MASISVALPSTIGKQPCVSEVLVDSGRTSPQQEETPLTIDHLIKITARSSVAQLPILAYPENGTTYTTYTPWELDQLVERAAVHYSAIIPQRLSSQDAVQTVALLGPSDLSYLVAILAVARLGHASLLLSTRITDEAYESLIRATNARFLLHGDAYGENAAAMTAFFPKLRATVITDCNTLRSGQTLPAAKLDLHAESSNISFIIHSSGSTGLPKPIVQTHKSCVHNYAQNFGLVGYCTLPLYHNHGISCLFRAISSRQMIYMYSAKSALTSSNLITTLQEHNNIQILYAVPYALKLLSESALGIELLAKLGIVMFGGSACPKPIGDALVAQGVNLVGHYGATEVGQLMTSMRDYDNDDGWDWLRVPPHLEPFLSMEPRGQGVFELCINDGWPSKVAANRPDNSYATKDLFEPHETMPNRWRYYARLDDTITLENGEKANPLLIEGTIRQNRHIAEVIVFGVGKPRLGAAIIPASSSDLSDTFILEELSPAITELNNSLPAYAQLSTDTIIVLPRDTVYRQTDKGTVIRAAFYKNFAAHIEQAYRETSSGTLVLPYAELVAFLERNIQSKIKRLESAHIDPDTDLFSLGVDSLQSLQIRSSIIKDIDTGGRELSRNFVFDFPTLRRAANEILRMQSGSPTEVQLSLQDRMQAMIEKYSCFDAQAPRVAPRGEYIAITGATGSLGAHTVAKLAVQTEVKKIYCLVRAEDHKTALQRVRASLRERQVYHTLDNVARRKIVALPTKNFGQTRCGLSFDDYEQLCFNLTRVIHLAWSVNFNKTLESFEQDCIAGVHNLINLCQASSRQSAAAFYFCSSVSATAATPGGAVPEALPARLGDAQNMGYAQSKLVAEHICLRAAERTGVPAHILRVGQIIGDSVHGIWNATEAIPLLLQTAKTVGALPALDESPSWLPVDVVAESIVEIMHSAADSGVMNIVNHKTFHWTRDLLPLLSDSGLKFETVDQQEWIARLRRSSPDAEQNPPIKLVDFFAGKYDTQEKRKGCVHATERSREFSKSLADSTVIDAASVRKMIAHFEQTAWNLTQSPAKPLVIVLGGPCGIGKSTVAARLSSELDLPFIEGDDIHSEIDRERMRNKEALTDADRQVWLTRLHGTVMDRLKTTKAKAVIVTCSALKGSYRDHLRQLQGVAGVRTLFLMLTLSMDDADQLRARMSTRQGHYMDPAMIDGQLSILETARSDEVDVVPVDAIEGVEQVYEEVRSVVKDALL